MLAIRNMPGLHMPHGLYNVPFPVVEGEINRESHEERMNQETLRFRKREYHMVHAGLAEHQSPCAFQERVCNFHL